MRVKKLIAALLLTALLGGCAIGGNQYYISISNSEDCDPTVTNTPTKTISPSLGASVSATAAASQQGAATNSGSSESSAR